MVEGHLLGRLDEYMQKRFRNPIITADTMSEFILVHSLKAGNSSNTLNMQHEVWKEKKQKLAINEL